MTQTEEHKEEVAAICTSEHGKTLAESRNDFGVFLCRADETDRSVEELIEAVRLDGSKAVYHENL